MASGGGRRSGSDGERQTLAEAVTGRAHGVRKLLGLDRSGPDPAETRQGQPLRPFTLPNFVGYLRLLSIPLFLVLAFESGDGRSTPATLLYLWITLGDLLDGFLARVTGQYSRMGALLDPIVDRLAALAGAAVCWHFDLLPHWAIVALDRPRAGHALPRRVRAARGTSTSR